MSGFSNTIQRGVEQGKAELRSRFVTPMVAGAVVWGLVTLFGVAGLIFLYVLADRYLADRLQDPVEAAAIIAGVNILLVLILVIARPGKRRR